MAISQEQDKYIRKVADELNKTKIIDIECRPVTIKDISQLKNNKILKVPHPRGFDISVRKEYIVDYVLGIPTLLYSEDEYIFADGLMGKHPLSFNAEDSVEYVNGLLGF